MRGSGLLQQRIAKGQTVRLSCIDCDRDDKEFITADQLAECPTLGWTDISEYQPFEASLKTYEGNKKPPPDFSSLDWFTHLGLCPDCQEGEAADRGPTLLPLKVPTP